MKTIISILLTIVVYSFSVKTHALEQASAMQIDSLKTGSIYRIVLVNDYEMTGMLIKQDTAYLYINTDYSSPEGQIQKVLKTNVSYCEKASYEVKAGNDKVEDKDSYWLSSVWFNAGTGGSFDNDHFYLPIIASLNSQLTKSSIISLRCVTNLELFLLFDPIMHPSENLWDLGILYGLISKNEHSLASLSAGVSIISGTKRGKFIRSTGFILSSNYYEENDFTTIGLPLQAQLIYKPVSSFGLGFTIFADINMKSTFWGAALSFSFGSL